MTRSLLQSPLYSFYGPILRDVVVASVRVLLLFQISVSSVEVCAQSTMRGSKKYESTNHLGNVVLTTTDRRTQVSTSSQGISGIGAVVNTAIDYYAFGMRVPGRTITTTAYRYGYNGQETVSELMGEDVATSFDARFLESRICRWLSIDPLGIAFPFASPYSSFNNSPIAISDPSGMGGELSNIKVKGSQEGTKQTADLHTTINIVVSDDHNVADVIDRFKKSGGKVGEKVRIGVGRIGARGSPGSNIWVDVTAYQTVNVMTRSDAEQLITTADLSQNFLYLVDDSNGTGEYNIRGSNQGMISEDALFSSDGSNFLIHNTWHSMDARYPDKKSDPIGNHNEVDDQSVMGQKGPRGNKILTPADFIALTARGAYIPVITQTTNHRLQLGRAAIGRLLSQDEATSIWKGRDDEQYIKIIYNSLIHR